MPWNYYFTSTFIILIEEANFHKHAKTCQEENSNLDTITINYYHTSYSQIIISFESHSSSKHYGICTHPSNKLHKNSSKMSSSGTAGESSGRLLTKASSPRLVQCIRNEDRFVCR